MDKKNITVQDVKDSYSDQKKKTDFEHHMWMYLVLRPLSFYITPFFIKMGLSANEVTILGGFVILMSFSFFLAGVFSEVYLIIGALLLNLWLLLDVIDGNISRVCNQQSDFGEFLDFLVGVIVGYLLPVIFSFTLYFSRFHLNLYSLNIKNEFWILIGLITLFSLALRRTASLKMATIKTNDQRIQSTAINSSKIKLVLKTIQSFFRPVLLLFIIFGYTGLSFWLIFYALFSLSTALGKILINLKGL